MQAAVVAEVARHQSPGHNIQLGVREILLVAQIIFANEGNIHHLKQIESYYPP